MRPPTGSAASPADSATLIATPKLRCGATTSSISVESFMRSNGSPLESSVSLARMARQRLRLLVQQPHVVGMLGIRLDRELELLGDQR